MKRKHDERGVGDDPGEKSVDDVRKDMTSRSCLTVTNLSRKETIQNALEEEPAKEQLEAI